MSQFFRTKLGAFVLFLIFAVVSQALDYGLGWLVFERLKLVNTSNLEWRPTLFMIFEGLTLVAVLIATFVVARLGSRPLRDLTFNPIGWPAKILEGSLWGLALPTLLILAIWSFGGFSWGSLNLHGSALATYGIGWLVAFFGVGLAEEATFRGPALRLLNDSIGFWPAAVVTSFLFALAHAGKPHEKLVDLLSVGLIGLFAAYTVKRTGSLWWAIGFHALFDYAALFLYGAPNSGNHGGQPIATRFLTGGYHGPEWLTGGILGIEASFLVFPLLAIAWATFTLATIRGTAIKEEET